MSEVKYIPEQRAFLIDGKIVREDTLTIEEKKDLLALCTGNLNLLIGNKSEIPKNQIILI